MEIMGGGGFLSNDVVEQLDGASRLILGDLDLRLGVQQDRQWAKCLLGLFKFAERFVVLALACRKQISHVVASENVFRVEDNDLTVRSNRRGVVAAQVLQR